MMIHGNSSSQTLVPVRAALHDLSQPVTASLCLLELARNQRTDSDRADVMALLLHEMERIANGVREVRNAVLAIEEAYS